MNQQNATIILQRVILHPKQIKNKIQVNCTYCDIPFQVWKSKYKTAQQKWNGNLYCSRHCSRKNQPNRYDKFYWCHKCKWLPQEKAVLKPKGTLRRYRNLHLHESTKMVYTKYYTKKDNFYCPKCDELLICRPPKRYQHNNNNNNKN
jgi:hypothetical protein